MIAGTFAADGAGPGTPDAAQGRASLIRSIRPSAWAPLETPRAARPAPDVRHAACWRVLRCAAKAGRAALRRQRGRANANAGRRGGNAASCCAVCASARLLAGADCGRVLVRSARWRAYLRRGTEGQTIGLGPEMAARDRRARAHAHASRWRRSTLGAASVARVAAAGRRRCLPNPHQANHAADHGRAARRGWGRRGVRG